MTARELVKDSLDNPLLVDSIPDDADLVSVGVNSGEIIRIALSCENVLDRPLSDPELAALNTIADVQALLERNEVAT